MKQKTKEQLETEAKNHMKETLDKLKDQNVARGKFLVTEDKRLTQMSDYINNALNNATRAYDRNIPIYRSGVVTNQLLHAYPDIFCQKAVAFALPEYQRIFSLYTLTTKEFILSYLPKWLDKPLAKIHNLTNSLTLFKAATVPEATVPGSSAAGNSQFSILNFCANRMQLSSLKLLRCSQKSARSANSQLSILNCQLKRRRRNSIVSAIASLSVYNDNYILLDKEDERAATLELPINRLATMIDYIQFLDPTPDTHTRLFTFLSELAREAKRINHRQLRLHNTKK